MRVLLTSIGSAGDINPFIALGSELKRRGHEVVLLVNPYFESGVTAAGLEYEPLGEYFSPTDLARETPEAFDRFRGPWVLIRHILAPLAREMYTTTRSLAERWKPDIIVCHQISFGVPWVAREFDIPFCTAALAPATMLSAESPSVYQMGIDLTNAPRWLRRLYTWQSRRAVSFILDGPMNAIRRDLGIPKVSDTLFGEMLSGEAILGMWSPTLRAAQSDDPPNLRICGFPWHDQSALYADRGTTLAPAVETFLQNGDPPVIFSFGSVLSHEADDEFRAAAKACEAINCRGILVTGNDSSAPTNLPDNVLALDYAPYSQLLSRGCMTVHHGGVGTTAQALRSAKPSIVVPFVHDQFDNAARVQRLGTGIWLPKRILLASTGLARTIETIRASASIQQKAAEIGRAIQSENGVATAAAVLEQIHGRNPASPTTSR